MKREKLTQESGKEGKREREKEGKRERQEWDAMAVGAVVVS